MSAIETEEAMRLVDRDALNEYMAAMEMAQSLFQRDDTACTWSVGLRADGIEEAIDTGNRTLMGTLWTIHEAMHKVADDAFRNALVFMYANIAMRRLPSRLIPFVMWLLEDAVGEQPMEVGHVLAMLPCRVDTIKEFALAMQWCDSFDYYLGRAEQQGWVDRLNAECEEVIR